MNLFGHPKGLVPLNLDVMMKCQCGMCPTQANSACAKPKIMAMMEMKKNMTPEMMKNMTMEQQAKMIPKPDALPGPYCANGMASCKDLDFSKTCICNTCLVFKEYSLMNAKPMSYFCKNGKVM